MIVSGSGYQNKIIFNGSDERVRSIFAAKIILFLTVTHVRKKNQIRYVTHYRLTSKTNTRCDVYCIPGNQREYTLSATGSPGESL